ncbi:MAG: PCRF domain-containing protein, partial [Myxococcales bacterium]|nr:PCRF domain-containing protein [Myxococcales bacterium]
MLPIDKLESLKARVSELEEMLCQPDVAGDSKRFMALSKERGDLAPLVAAYEEYSDQSRRLREDREALSDPELREMVAEEIPELEKSLEELEAKIHILLLPTDPNDERNTILEIRAGAGGEEAALFAADLFRAYSRYAERVGWKIEILSTSEATAGGIKEIVCLI